MRAEIITLLLSVLLLNGQQLAAPSASLSGPAVLASVASALPASSLVHPVASAADSVAPATHTDPTQQTPGDPPAPTIQAAPVPVLMYHELGDGPNELYLAIDDFVGQLDYLKAEGYHTVTLRQLYDHRIKGNPLPEKPIVLTFDDGYLSVYTEAFPRLSERGMTATLFIESGHVGWHNRLDWGHLLEMVEAGFEVGSHSQTHADLTFLARDELLKQVQGSKSTLEERLSITVASFCYPAGQYDATVLALVQEAGYLAAVTTEYGRVGVDDDPYLWSRIRVSRSDHVEGLISKLGSDP